MEPKTSKSYQEAVLEQYKKEKGGEMSGYLFEPTPKQLREACIALIAERNSKNDLRILKRFFQFKEENRVREIENFDINRFKPLVNFLKGKTNTTSPENIELISWLIDFRPRPRQAYLASKNQKSYDGDMEDAQEGTPNTDKSKPIDTVDTDHDNGLSLWIKTIAVTLVLLLVILSMKKCGDTTGPMTAKPTDECMAWADTLYISLSCNTGYLSKYGSKVEPLDLIRLKSMRKIEVSLSYQFFAEDGKPLVWYYKNDEGEIEYYTAPGFHPVNGETLKKITPYIIDKYVPIHKDKKDTFKEPKVQKDTISKTAKPQKKQQSADAKEMTLLIFSKDNLDAPLVQQLQKTVFATYIHRPMAVVQGYQKELAHGTISHLEEIWPKDVRYMVIGNAEYLYRKVNGLGRLVSCDLALDYNVYIKVNGKLRIYDSKSQVVTGSGFSEISAKRNAIQKIGESIFAL